MSDNKTNKVKYNLKNVHVAVLTKTTEGYSYATPKHIPGAVSLSLDPEGDSNPFYADGIVYFRSTSNNGYSGDLEMALIPEWFFTDVLKETLDSNGVLVDDKGKVTAAIAKAFAESEFEKFRVLQDRTYQSDFDRLVASIEHNDE